MDNRWSVLRLFVSTACAVLLITGCGVAVKSSVKLAIPKGEGKISILFQDFADGSSCTVKTTDGDLTVAELPGEIEYPSSYRAAPISCTNTDGTSVDLDLNSMLPETFRSAGITARPDGSLFVTVGTKEGLFQIQNEAARKRIGRK